MECTLFHTTVILNDTTLVRLAYASGSLSLLAGGRRAWLSRITWMDVGNGCKHSIYKETNRWLSQAPGDPWPSYTPVPSPCSAPGRLAPRDAPHVLTTLVNKLIDNGSQCPPHKTELQSFSAQRPCAHLESLLPEYLNGNFVGHSELVKHQGDKGMKFGAGVP